MNTKKSLILLSKLGKEIECGGGKNSTELENIYPCNVWISFQCLYIKLSGVNTYLENIEFHSKWSLCTKLEIALKLFLAVV